MKSILTVFILFLCLNTAAQDFFRNRFSDDKTYILIANPTAKNIETIKFLIENKLLKVNTRNVEFVGVYHKTQRYDFNEALLFIQSKGLTGFHLHEFRETLDQNRLFEKNQLSAALEYVFTNSAGIIFFGGPDIPPAVYEEENKLSVVTDPERHYFEVTFLFHLLGGFQNEQVVPFLETHPEYLVTGFCLGMQTMNVATGGTLIQDIPSEIYGATLPQDVINTGRENMHRNYWQEITEDPQLMGINFHRIQFADHPFFKEKVKAKKHIRPLVYSSHHQAVEKKGKGLEATAFSTDGTVVEGLAHNIYPYVFSVQFHPEVPALYEEMEPRKFHPSDTPQPYHRLLGKESLKFHRNYWKFISKAVKKAAR